jgi:hypothetical protein
MHACNIALLGTSPLPSPLFVRNSDAARHSLLILASGFIAAETGSNDNSSRSHSVFNIKLFKGDGADVKDENQVLGV